MMVYKNSYVCFKIDFFPAIFLIAEDIRAALISWEPCILGYRTEK